MNLQKNIENTLSKILENEVALVTVFSTESENRVILFKTITGGKKYIVKYSKGKQTLSTNKVAKIHNYLSSVSIHFTVPEILHTINLAGGVMQVFKHIEGEVGIPKKNEDIPNYLLNVLVSSKELHSIKLEDVKSFWQQTEWDGRSDVTWKDFALTELDKTIKTVPEIVKIQVELKNVIISAKTSPIHGDLKPANTIILENKKLVLLDFDNARVGDPCWDLAYFWGMLELENSKIALMLYELLRSKLNASLLKHVVLYNTFFHAWTLRDLLESEQKYYVKNVLQNKLLRF